MKQFFRMFCFCIIGICGLYANTIISYAAKYDYTINGGVAYYVSAGKDYNLSNGYVGCPQYVNNYLVRSIAAKGFYGWGTNQMRAKIPISVLNIGDNAFYTSDSYKPTQRLDYQAGVEMPGIHFKDFYRIGFSAYTPLYENCNIPFVCDISPKSFTYDGKMHVPNTMVYWNNTPMSSFADIYRIDNGQLVYSNTMNADGESILPISEDENALVTPGQYRVIFPIFDATKRVRHATQTYGTYDFTIAPFDINNAKIAYSDNTDEDEAYIYTGKAIPLSNLTITVKPDALEEDENYTVTYQNNINAGTATATIQGIGNYTGTKVIHYTIQPIDLTDSDCIIELEESEFTITNQPIQPLPIVKLKKKDLICGRDYIVQYDSDCSSAGTKHVYVIGTGNFTGTYKLTYEIIDPNADVEPEAPEEPIDEPIDIPEEPDPYESDWDNDNWTPTATKSVTKLKKPTFTAKKKGKKLTLQLKSYQGNYMTVQYKTKKGKWKKLSNFSGKIKKKKTKKFTFKKASIRLRTYKKSGYTVIYSPWSKIIKLKK